MIPPPPIQGIGNAAGFAMQVELRDGNADFGKLQAVTGAMVANAQTQSAPAARQLVVPRDGAAISTSRSTGSRPRRCTSPPTRYSRRCRPISARAYVNQFNKFGRTFQVYVQADAQFRLTARDIENLMVRNQQGDMIPLGTVAKITPSVGPSLISLYNLYPSATVIGLPAHGLQFRPVDGADGGDRGQDPAAGHRL